MQHLLLTLTFFVFALQVQGQEWYEQAQSPLTADELAAQNYLVSITNKLPGNKSDDVWKIGGSQHSVLSARYNIAFVGYAAGVLGMRTPAYPEQTRNILRNTIDRILDKYVWSYVVSYWKYDGIPDPCAFENIMYTGHVLQLMATWELFSGDRRFHKKGFDFVWDHAQDQKTHYTVEKLIDVTVRQMRKNKTGGVTCEPGLCFFPCNNHPQIALRLFESLGYGDWKAERSKWEFWALKNLTHPLFGGGTIKYLYHTPTRMTTPRGHTGLDGWTLLWYLPWAEDEHAARNLWKNSTKYIDWKIFSDLPSDQIPKKSHACAGDQVPPVTTASFMAASARAFGDKEVAQRFETFTDKHFLKREDDLFFLNCDRQWRPGASANRIIALAIENGSNIREFVMRPLPKDYYKGPYLERVDSNRSIITEAYRDHNGLNITISGRGETTKLYFRNVLQNASITSHPEVHFVWNGKEQSLVIPQLPTSLKLNIR